ncbi:MAG: ABC transporter permease subunit [Haloarculaceae archaeon]
MRRALRVLATVLVLLAAWQVGSLLFGPGLLPSPLRVAARLAEVLAGTGPRDRGALYHLGRSFLRVAVVSVLGLVLSTALGLAMGVDDRVERLVAVWLPLWMTVPTLVVVLVSMVLLDFSEWAVVVGVTFVATPFATANVWEGARAVDPALLEMGRAFDVDRWVVLREVYLPATLPQVVGSFRYLLGMVWKVVVLAETFGLENGLGAMFRFWFNQGDVTAVLAYLSLFVVVMVTLQYGLRAASDRLFAWRG